MTNKIFQEGKQRRKWEVVKNADFYKPMVEEAKNAADAFVQKPILAHNYQDFKLFYTTGSRKEYERGYFDRRARLNVLSVMSMISDDEIYITKLEDVIWAICDEFSWAVPAHIPNDLPMRDFRIFIDLFAAETGFALSEILFLLEDKLSDKIKSRIEFEVRERIIESYLNRRIDFWWERIKNNWAAVCAGSVGAAFMYLATEEEFYKVKDNLLGAIDSFLSGFENDGACMEGYGYFLYGFGFFTYFASLLKQYTNGDINLFNLPKVQKIAEFQQKVILYGDKAISFSDGHQVFRHNIGLSHFLYRNFKGIQLPSSDIMSRLGDDDAHRWAAYIRNFVWSDESLKDGSIGEAQYYLEDSAWYIKRSSKYSFAAKAGHNNEPHNHNDIGNFIFNIGNECILYDLGMGEYTKDYFGEKRYSFLCNSSRGHNVPVIDGNYQKAGREFGGKVIKAVDNEFELEFSKAYGLDNLKQLKRKFTLFENGILLHDEFSFTKNPISIAERFISLKKPTKSSGKYIIDSGVLEYDENVLDGKIIEEEYSNHGAVKTKVYIIELTFRNPDVNCFADIKVLLK